MSDSEINSSANYSLQIIRKGKTADRTFMTVLEFLFILVCGLNKLAAQTVLVACSVYLFGNAITELRSVAAVGALEVKP